MARKKFPRTTTCPGKAVSHRGFCCFGHKAEHATMGRKGNHRFGGTLRGGLKEIVGKAKSRLSPTPAGADEKKTQARGVIVVEALIETDHDAELVIKARLSNGIDEVTANETEGKRTYANPAGHGFEQEFHEMNQKLDALFEGAIEQKDENARQKNENAKQKDVNALLIARNTEQESVNASLVAKNTAQESINDSINARITQLQTLANGYKEVRQRMFTVYKRDIKGQSHLGRSRSIAVGNAHAHDADALTDARLFSDDPFWQDRSTYVELYGLQFEEVLAYRQKFNDDSKHLFGILDAHANMLLQGKILGRPLGMAFRSFLQAVERLSLEDRPTNLESQWTYGAFWHAYAKN